MASEPDPERLRALEDKIALLKSGAKPDKSATAKSFAHGELAWRMIAELLAGIGIGSGIGYGIDQFFGTMPLFLIVFLLLGFVAAIRTIVGTAREVGDKISREEQISALAAKVKQAERSAENEGN